MARCKGRPSSLKGMYVDPFTVGGIYAHITSKSDKVKDSRLKVHKKNQRRRKG